MATKEYLSRAEAANYLTDRGLPIARSQLMKLASVGGGPTFFKFGNKALYRPDDLLDWASSRLIARK